MEMKPVGFAFNRAFIQGLLREQMGFEGYVNSDSGISNKMAWGWRSWMCLPESRWLSIPEWISSADPGCICRQGSI